MNNFKTFTEKESQLIVEGIVQDVTKKLWNKSVDFTKNTWNKIRHENEDIKLAFNILTKMVKGETVSDAEKKIVKDQAKDLLKIGYSISLSPLSKPIAMITLLFVIGGKYGINIFPDSSNKQIINQIRKEEEE